MGITVVLKGAQKLKNEQIAGRSVDVLNLLAKFFKVLEFQDYVAQKSKW